MLLKEKKLLVLSFVLLAICFQVGFWLASRRDVWNDEIYTQKVSIGQRTYFELIQGKISEGNVTPLFYLLQKGLCDTFHYQFPEEWSQGHWRFVDQPSQIFLRINPVLFMSLAIVALFYFFSRFYGWGVGLYSLVVTFSSYMIWAYWTEARPYALWVFLTTLQSLFFLFFVQEKKSHPAAWKGLTITHWALAFSTVFGLAQIAILSFLLWIFVEKRWSKYIFLSVIPIAIGLFYYLHSPGFKFYFVDSPLQLISASYPKDRLIVLFIFMIVLLAYFLQKKISFLKGKINDSIRDGIPYLCLTVLMFIPSFLAIYKFKMTDTHGADGFFVSNRYFIYLAPISIIACVVFPIYLWRAFKGKRWLQLIVLAVVVGLLILRIQKTFALIQGYYDFS